MDLQTKVESLSINGKTTELKINLGKTVLMKWNVNPGIKIKQEGIDMEEVEKFVYLGATVTTTGGAGEDISAGTSSLLQLKEHLEDQSTQHKNHVQNC